MQQAWYDLLFAHWLVDARELRKLVPPELELDLFEGQAYAAVVPFGMDSIRLRGLPPIPGTHKFLELNVRTYVRLGGRPGVYFFSLDAASPIAVRAARLWFGLPYYDARMSLEEYRDDGSIRYRSTRTHRKAQAAALAVDFGPTGPTFVSKAGSLEHWLTERYCMYMKRGKRIWRGEIHHEPWPLQPARAEFQQSSMLEAAGLQPQGAPHLLFVRRIEVAIWSPVRV